MSEYVMYIAAIKMPPGKLAAQVGHAVLGLYQQHVGDEGVSYVVQSWMCMDPRKDGGTQAKIVLKANPEDFKTLFGYLHEHGVLHYIVHDAGRTVVEPGTLTAVAFGPVLRDEDGPWKTMRLY